MRLKLHELGIFARFTRKMLAHYKIRERLNFGELGFAFASRNESLAIKEQMRHAKNACLALPGRDQKNGRASGKGDSGGIGHGSSLVKPDYTMEPN
jgi:hypothetical protein